MRRSDEKSNQRWKIFGFRELQTYFTRDGKNHFWNWSSALAPYGYKAGDKW